MTAPFPINTWANVILFPFEPYLIKFSHWIILIISVRRHIDIHRRVGNWKQQRTTSQRKNVKVMSQPQYWFVFDSVVCDQ